MPSATPYVKPYPPEIIRRVLDDIANEDAPVVTISDYCGVKVSTIKSWQAIGRIRRGRKISKSELDKAVEQCVNSGRLPDSDGYSVTGVSRPVDWRELTDEQKEYVRLGYMGMGPPAPKLTASELAAFAGVLSCVDRQLADLEKATEKSESIQEVTTALTAAIGLKQLREAYLNPPPIVKWQDVIGIVEMTRTALGMHTKLKADAPRIGVDVNILSVRPNGQRKKVIDVIPASEEVSG